MRITLDHDFREVEVLMAPSEDLGFKTFSRICARKLTRLLFQTGVASTLLPVFTAIVGYVFGERKGAGG